MQPVLVVRSSIPGVVYINGRFAGEADVMLPVGVRGAVYVELRPMAQGYLPMARRIALSNGVAVPGSMEGQAGVYLVQWPGNVLDMELWPEAVGAEPPKPQFEGADAAAGTAEGAALGALRAARLGLMDEAAAYIAPGADAGEALREAGLADDCVRLKYPCPGGEQAVGLLRLEGDNLATVRPIAYRAEQLGGAWRLTQLAPVKPD